MVGGDFWVGPRIGHARRLARRATAVSMKRHYIALDVFTDRRRGDPPPFRSTPRGCLRRRCSRSWRSSLSPTTFAECRRRTAHAEHAHLHAQGQLPFAGHPNVGTVFALATLGKVERRRIVSRRIVELVPIDIVREYGVAIAAPLAAPRNFSWGDRSRPTSVAQVCGLAAGEIESATHLPVIASCGVGFVIAEVKSRAVLAKAPGHADVFAQPLRIWNARSAFIFTCTAKEVGHGYPNPHVRAALRRAGRSRDRQRQRRPWSDCSRTSKRSRDLTLARTHRPGRRMGRPSVLEASAEKKSGTVVDDLHRRPLRPDDARDNRAGLRAPFETFRETPSASRRMG